MAECHGLWSSWINAGSDFPELPQPSNDGVLFADREDNLGNFRGAHLPSFEPLSGQCIPPVNTPRRLVIVRTGQGHIYRYVGEVTEDSTTALLIARGKRSTVVTRGDRPELLPDDDVWIAVKTT